VSIDLDAIKGRIANGIYGDDRLTGAEIFDALAALDELIAEVERLRAENRKLRDVLEWVNTQCPGKCAGVCDAALRGEHRIGSEP
jgi:regulator of replication initiation timing